MSTDRQKNARTVLLPEEFAELAKDDDVVVRRHVAANTAAPYELILELARHDRDHEVRLAAVRNPHLGRKGLLELIRHGDKHSHKAIAQGLIDERRLETPASEVLTAMASSPSHALQMAALDHDTLSDELVMHLTHEKQHADVVAKAQQIAHARKLDKKPGFFSRLFGG
jgi:hypothetical protein